MLDDTWDGFYRGGELGRIGDRSGRAVHDDSTSVRDPWSGQITVKPPRLGRYSDARQPLCGLRATEGDDLDRQWRAGAELIDALFRRRYKHIVVTREGNKLLAEERAAAALDGVERGIDLVGAIDAEVEAVGVVERDKRDAQIASQGFRALRGWDGREDEPSGDAEAQLTGDRVGS